MQDENFIKNLLPKRPKNSHKGTFGHVLNIAGSCFYSGAAYFSSISPLLVGCGRCTLASTESVLKIVAGIAPDIILLPIEETKEKTISPKSIKTIKDNLYKFQVITVGCGISENKNTATFFEKLLKILVESETPVVIDADGIALLAKLKIKTLPINTILTPHPKELSALMEVSTENILMQPEFWVKKCSDKYNCITVLKLHETLVSDNKGNLYVNKTGNSALSHGGSGDILCGMIGGLLAQGLNCFDASLLGTYLHGLTGELASRDLTEYSTLSSDILKYIPDAIKTIN